jgi:hypothetical protein
MDYSWICKFHTSNTPGNSYHRNYAERGPESYIENFCAGYKIILKWIRTEVIAIVDFIHLSRERQLSLTFCTNFIECKEFRTYILKNTLYHLVFRSVNTEASLRKLRVFIATLFYDRKSIILMIQNQAHILFTVELMNRNGFGFCT